MANVLTALAPILYGAARVAPRELTGILGAVNRAVGEDSQCAPLAEGQFFMQPAIDVADALLFTTAVLLGVSACHQAQAEQIQGLAS